MEAVFIAVQRVSSKPVALTEAVRLGGNAKRYDVAPDSFRRIPRSPFAYWVREEIRTLFSTMPPLQSANRGAFFGASTKSDFRFLRLWYEIACQNAVAWRPHAKGGTYSKYFSDLDLLVNWEDDGAELKAFVSSYRAAKGWGHQWTAELKGATHYGRAGLTWPRRTQAGLGFRALPAGTIFGDKGPAILVEGDSGRELLTMLALVNSEPFRLLVGLQMTFGSYEVGVIQRTPTPACIGESAAILAALARRGWSVRRSLGTVSEVSHAFVVPAVLQVSAGFFGDRVEVWAGKVVDVEAELKRVQSRIDELCFELYGISEEDRRALTDGFGVADTGDHDSDGETDGVESGSSVESDPAGLAAGLVSWAVGVAVGRFDVRLATGERKWPAEPDPFAPLSVCSAAMLTGDDGLPPDAPPNGYPVDTSEVLVDDPGHELDLAERVRAVFDVVFGGEADCWWTDVGAMLDPKAGEIEAWLRKEFFDHHLKTYSGSHRKAPILWPLGTKSGSYRVWLYAHRVTADTLFRVLADVVEPKLAAERRRLSDLTQESRPSPAASQRKALHAQESFVAELADLRDELVAVAPLWAPDLNDGIVIVLAPLWRLFAHHRVWSNELKSRWKTLAAGGYDWAQLAMHIWPERVVPKCAGDRSLAIAHGLEDTFWVHDDDNPGKWHPGHTSTTSADQLIADRANPTIQTARTHPTP